MKIRGKIMNVESEGREKMNEKKKIEDIVKEIGWGKRKN